MEFIGLGGVDEVGASSSLYRLKEGTLLIDFGLRPGLLGLAGLPALEPALETPPDAVLVTHAHLDHVGGLPVLSSRFPGVPLYMTAPTARLLTLNLADTLKVSAAQGQQLFTAGALKSCLERVRIITAGETLTLEGSRGTFQVEVQSAGHLLGAVSARIHSPGAQGGAGGTVFHTGDFSNIAGFTTPAAYKPPQPLPGDATVTESTYGDTNLPSRKEQIRAFIASVKAVLERGGTVLIPTFALGRSQEIVGTLLSHMLGGLLPVVPIFLDGLVRPVTETYESLLEFLPEGVRNAAHNARQPPLLRAPVELVNSDEQRERIFAGREPGIVLASSGMLHAGRSPQYARALLPSEQHALFIVGYQDAESPGRRLLSLERGGEIELPEMGRSVRTAVSVNAEVTRFYLSAHADRGGILGHLASYPAPRVVLTHGEWNARSALAEHLSSKVDTVLAKNGDVVPLLAPVRPRATAGFALPGKAALERLSRPQGEAEGEGEVPVRGGFEAKVRFAVGEVPGVYDAALKTFTLDLSSLRNPEVFESGSFKLEAKKGNTLSLRLKQRGGPAVTQEEESALEEVSALEEADALEEKSALEGERKLSLEEKLERNLVPERFKVKSGGD